MKIFHYVYLVMFFALPFSLTSQNPEFNLAFPSGSIGCETSTFTTDLNIKNFTDVNAFNFIITWDPTVLVLNQVIDQGVLNDLPSAANGNELIFSWASLNAQSSVSFTTTDQTILKLDFEVVGNSGDDVDLFFTNLSTIQSFIPVTPVTTPLFITIEDNQDPTINCDAAPSLTVDTGGGTTTQITGAGFTATDNCDIQFVSYELTDAMTGAILGVGMGDVSNNVFFDVGTTTVTYTATDWENNTAECSFDVIVTNITGGSNVLTVDIEDETVDCAEQTVTIDIVAVNFTDMLSASFSLDWATPSLTFVEVVPTSIAFNSGVTFNTASTNMGKLRFEWDAGLNGTPVSLGNGTVLFSVTYDINSTAGFTLPIVFDADPAFAPVFINQTSAPNPMDSADISLMGGGVALEDTENPTLSCPTDDVTVISSNGANAVVNGLDPSPNDNCGIASTTYTLTDASNMNVIATGNDDASGFTFPIGTTIVEYVTTDNVGLTNTCTFNVVVVDPNSVTVGIDSIDVDCGASSVLIGFPVEDFFEVVTITYSVNWDPAQLGFVGVVQDNMPNQSSSFVASNGELSFTWSEINNPTTFNDGDDLFVVEFNILDNTPGNSYDIVFDNLTPIIVLTQSSFPNSISSGNITALPGNVELIDNTPPTVTTCPSNQNVSSQNSIVSGIGIVADDNCGIASISYTLTDAATMNVIGSGSGNASGFDFPLGTTTVQYEVTDLAGNTNNSCSFDVTVVDAASLTVGIDSTTVDCDETSVIVGFPVRNFSDVISVQYTVEWNPAELELVAVIQDNMPSAASFGQNQLADGKLTFFWADLSAPATFNNGDDLFLVEFNVLNNTGGNSYDITFGTLPTPLSITTQASFPSSLSTNNILAEPGNVTTTDDIPPTVICPGDKNAFATNGVNAVVNGITPTASDNCGVASVTYTLTDANTLNNIGSGNDDASGSTFPLGTTIVEYTVTDFDGNTVSCSFNVNVIDANSIIIGIDSATVDCETNVVTLGFPVQNFVDILSVQFTVEWNPADLQYSAVTQDNMPTPASFGDNLTDDGELTFFWADLANPATFNDGESLFEVEFNILNNAGGSSFDIVFGLLPTPTNVVTTTSFPSSVP
ncbi:MAG: HYR domain-containing protein, partial [Bacteroidota bacterium]